MNTKSPKGWKMMQLSEVGKIVTGNTPSKFKPENYGNDIVWVKPPDLDKTKYVDTSSEKISSKARNLVRLVSKGSVLVSCIGIIGKVAIADCELCTNQQINTIIPNKNVVDSEFLYYTIKKMRSFLQKQGSSAVVPLLNKSEFSKIMIPIPSISTQKKIVTVLEKAEKVRELRKEADKLTEEFLKAVFLEMFGEFIFSDKTHTEPLENVLLRIESGWSPICEPYPRTHPDQTAVLKLGSVTYGFFNPDENKYLPPEIEIIKKITVKKNDLLFSRKNTHDLVAATAFVFDSYENLLLPDTIFKLVYDESKINGIYLWKLLSEANFKKQVQNLATGSAGSMPNISKERLMKFEIPIPPISLQEEFAFIVREIESMKNFQKQSKEYIENLFSNIIQKSFKGELT